MRVNLSSDYLLEPNGLYIKVFCHCLRQLNKNLKIAKNLKVSPFLQKKVLALHSLLYPIG